MTIKKKLFDLGISAIRFSCGLFGESKKTWILSYMVEQLSPLYSHHTSYGDIKFYCIGEIPLWRAETLLTKEPETIEWIGSFKKGEILWDIGANIGCYSLYAAKKGNPVIAFEPSASNYFLFQKNIEYNQLDKNIQAFCLAFSDTSEFGYLNMSSIQMGGAISNFGEVAEIVEHVDESYDVKFSQGMISFSIDEFIRYYHIPTPNHIKIDVDGIENKIIRGAKHTLNDKNLKSLLIELDFNHPEYNEEIFRILYESGFTLESKKHAPMFDGGKYASNYNCIFIRK
jgi:FkbM family methyltransferase